MALIFDFADHNEIYPVRNSLNRIDRVTDVDVESTF